MKKLKMAMIGGGVGAFIGKIAEIAGIEGQKIVSPDGVVGETFTFKIGAEFGIFSCADTEEIGQKPVLFGFKQG